MCEGCFTQNVPGIIIGDSDDREESRDGRVWIQRCDQCTLFGSDAEAAVYLAEVTGWTLMKSYDRDDALDAGDRQRAAGKDWWRPYFDKTVAEVERYIYGRLPPTKERVA